LADSEEVAVRNSLGGGRELVVKGMRMMAAAATIGICMGQLKQYYQPDTAPPLIFARGVVPSSSQGSAMRQSVALLVVGAGGTSQHPRRGARADDDGALAAERDVPRMPARSRRVIGQRRALEFQIILTSPARNSSGQVVLPNMERHTAMSSRHTLSSVIGKRRCESE
jgi:hypothetical protein